MKNLYGYLFMLSWVFIVLSCGQSNNDIVDTDEDIVACTEETKRCDEHVQTVIQICKNGIWENLEQCTKDFSCVDFEELPVACYDQNQSHCIDNISLDFLDCEGYPLNGWQIKDCGAEMCVDSYFYENLICEPSLWRRCLSTDSRGYCGNNEGAEKCIPFYQRSIDDEPADKMHAFVCGSGKRWLKKESCYPNESCIEKNGKAYCEAPLSEKCKNDGESYCLGGYISVCEDGRLVQRSSCAEIGWGPGFCYEPDFGQAACRSWERCGGEDPVNHECNDDHTYCVDNHIIGCTCELFDYRGNIDCTERNSTCVEHEDGLARCESADEQPDSDEEQ